MSQLSANSIAIPAVVALPALPCPMPLRCLQELVHQHSIFKLLGQASSRVLQLMLKLTSKEQSKTALLLNFMQLQLLLPSFISAWVRSTGDLAAEAAAAEKQLSLQQLQETGDALDQQQHHLLQAASKHTWN
jgi:hypothetical protein